MITINNINAIQNEKIFFDTLKVKRIGANVFTVIGFNYGEEEVKCTGYAKDAMKFLNGYFGYMGE